MEEKGGFLNYKDANESAYNLAGNYMFKVNYKSNRTNCEICSKLTIKATNRAFIVNFDPISRLVLVFLLFTLSRKMLAGKVVKEFNHFR